MIPEGRALNQVQQPSPIYRVTSIKNLEQYLTYANSKNLCTVYLSFQYGVLLADDLVLPPKVSAHMLDDSQLLLWSQIVAEMLYRNCLEQMVTSIHFLIEVGRKKYFRPLMKELELRGVKVFDPIY